jgi:hypothetical protein
MRKAVIAALVLSSVLASAQVYTPSVSDAPYGAGWNGDKWRSPSRNALWDVISTLAPGGDPNIVAIAGIDPAAGDMFYWTAPGAVTKFATSAWGRARMADADAAAGLTAYGVSSWVQSLLGCTDANSLRPAVTPYTFNVMDAAYGAKGDGVTDDTAAIRAAIAAALAAVETVSGGLPGSFSHSSGTAPVVYFPPGKYVISDYLTADADGATTYVTYRGEKAIFLPDANDFTIFGGVGFMSRFEGLTFRNGYKAIEVRNNNINATQIDVVGCEFVSQVYSSLSSHAASGSFILNVDRCKFYQRNTVPGYIGYFPMGDTIRFQGCWFQAYTRTAFYNAGALYVRDSVGVPGGALVATGGRWFYNLNVVDIEGFRMGGESGGAYCLVWHAAEPDTSVPITPTRVSIRDSPGYADKWALRLDELPNIIEMQGVYGLSSNDFRGIEVNETTISLADVQNWNRWGEINTDRNFYQSITGDSQAAGTVGGLLSAVMVTKAARFGDYPGNAVDRIPAADIYGSAEWGTGWTNSGTLTGSYVDDAYGVQQRQWAATGSGQSETSVRDAWLTAAALTYGQTYTACIKYDVTAVSVARVYLYLGGCESHVYQLSGQGWLCVPFVYLNDTGAALTATDRAYWYIALDASGDSIRLGRMLLLKGLVPGFRGDVLTMHSNAAPAASAVGLAGHTGYFVGDLNWRDNVAANGVLLDACVTAGTPGTWDTMTLDP